MARVSKQMRLLPVLVLIGATGLGGDAAAQSFEGSFDDGSFGGGTAAPPPPATGGSQNGGSFEGSFGDDFGAGSGVVAEPVSPPPPEGGGAMPGGDDFGDGGSFDTGIAAPVTPAQPPVQQPPTQQPPQGPQIDPQVTAFETRDFGVPPTPHLRQDQFHAPTPTSVPGAQLLTTESLAQAMQAGVAMVVIDVLGGQYTLPNAFKAPALASPGSLTDGIQQQASQWLQQITQGNASMPIVVYCSDPNCWLSYNGVLRAVAAGYTNVYWYRGGLQSWQMAGLQLSVGGF